MKKVIAACIDRVLEFSTQKEGAIYIEGLRAKNSNFKVLYCKKIGDKYCIRVQEQYNKSPMIEN